MDQENTAPQQFAALFGQPPIRYLPVESRAPLMPMIPVPRPASMSDLNSLDFGHLSLKYVTPGPDSMDVDSESSDTVTIIYDLGRKSFTIDKKTLCDQSAFFARAFAKATRIRIRNDFPFGAQAMLDFLSTGSYSYHNEMVYRYPLVTLIDLHVHAYLCGAKYFVPSLAALAISKFQEIGYATLAMDFTNPMQNPDVFTRPPGMPVGSGAVQYLRPYPKIFEDSTASAPKRDEVDPPPYDPRDCSPEAQVERLLNAITLLWKNTAPEDVMRKAVIEMVKTELNKLLKLKFFTLLMHNLEDFGDAVVKGLQDDGLEVEVYSMRWLKEKPVVVKFDTPVKKKEHKM